MRRMQKRQDAKLKLLILALQLVKEILVLAYLVLDRLLDSGRGRKPPFLPHPVYHESAAFAIPHI